MWTETSPTREARTRPTVTKLADGRVLAVGGGKPWGHERSAEIYDPAADIWTAAAPMGEGRVWAPSALLPDGRVLVAAGTGPDPRFGLPYPSKTAEIYDPVTDTWTRAGSLTHPRGMGTAMAVLTDGRPVIIDGHNGIGGRVEDTVEIYRRGHRHVDGGAARQPAALRPCRRRPPGQLDPRRRRRRRGHRQPPDRLSVQAGRRPTRAARGNTAARRTTARGGRGGAAG